MSHKFEFLVFVYSLSNHNCHFFKKSVYIGGFWRSVHTKTYPLFLRNCEFMLSFIIVVCSIVEKIKRVKRQHVTILYVNVCWWLLCWSVIWWMVCVCLQVNHRDVIRLGVKVVQDLFCIHHYIPRSSGKPL